MRKDAPIVLSKTILMYLPTLRNTDLQYLYWHGLCQILQSLGCDTAAAGQSIGKYTESSLQKTTASMSQSPLPAGYVKGVPGGRWRRRNQAPHGVTLLLKREPVTFLLKQYKILPATGDEKCLRLIYAVS